MSNKLFIDIIKENRKSSILAAFFKVLFALSVTFLSYYLSLLFDAFDKGRNEFYKSIVYACLILLSIVILSFVSDFFKALYIKATNKSLKNKMSEFSIDMSYDLIKYIREISHGIINMTVVHPREVFKRSKYFFYY